MQQNPTEKPTLLPSMRDSSLPAVSFHYRDPVLTELVQARTELERLSEKEELSLEDTKRVVALTEQLAAFERDGLPEQEAVEAVNMIRLGHDLDQAQAIASLEDIPGSWFLAEVIPFLLADEAGPKSLALSLLTHHPTEETVSLISKAFDETQDRPFQEAAIGSLGKIPLESAAEKLVLILRDVGMPEAIRAMAAAALEAHDYPFVTRCLVVDIVNREDEAGLILAALKGLGGQDDGEAFSCLEEAITQKPEPFSVAAAKALHPDRADWTLKTLIDAAEGTRRDTRIAAIESLSRSKAKSAEATILQAANSDQLIVRNAAFIALGNIDSEASTDALLKAIKKDDETSSVVHCINSLAGRTEERVTEVLVNCLLNLSTKDGLPSLRFQDRKVRHAAAQALKFHAGPLVEKALLNAMLDPENASGAVDITESAKDSLRGRKTPELYEVLISLVSSGHKSEGLLSLLGEYQATGARRALIEVVDGEDSENRKQAALLALLSDESPEVIYSAIGWLHDDSIVIRRAASRLLSQSSHPAIKEPLIGVLRSREDDAAVLMFAAQGLKQFREPRVTTALIQLLENSKHTQAKSGAANALSNHMCDEVEATLTGALHLDSHQHTWNSARLALIRNGIDPNPTIHALD